MYIPTLVTTLALLVALLSTQKHYPLSHAIGPYNVSRFHARGHRRDALRHGLEDAADLWSSGVGVVVVDELLGVGNHAEEREVMESGVGLA
jgi:hypothetical protein